MTRANLAKDTAIVCIGGDEDETKKQVQLLFKKNNDPYKALKQSDCNYLDELHDLQEALELF